jgi:2-dehydropantoate 2-reductase
MRLLILGAGGVGGYFGARLAAAGVDVTFLVREARATRLAQDGLVVASPHGDLTLPVAAVTEAREPFDAVLLSCKAYDLDSAMEAIAPAVGADTLVLPLLNGLRHLDALDARFGSARVIGGLAQIVVTMTAEGVIRQLTPLQRLILGPRVEAQEERSAALHAELARGGFDPSLSPDIMQDMWQKFTMLTTFAGMTCLMRAPVGAIVATNEGAAIAEELLQECAAVATANGHSPRAAFLADARAMITTPRSPNTASMLRDLESGGRTEHDHILGDMLARARAAAIPAPILRIAYAHMQAYAERRAG